MADRRRIRIANPTGSIGGSHVAVDGVDVTTAVVGLAVRHRVGEIPTVDLDLHAGDIDVDTLSHLRLYRGGRPLQFTEHDVRTLWTLADGYGSPWLRDFADRLNRHLPAPAAPPPHKPLGEG